MIQSGKHDENKIKIDFKTGFEIEIQNGEIAWNICCNNRIECRIKYTEQSTVYVI